MAPGDPVILTAVPDASVRGSYAEYTTVPASRVLARPAGLGVVESAAIWVACSTAYGALVEKATTRPGDHVLITAASGSVGRAAVQIANQIGAVPIAVTRHAAKEDDLLTAGAAAVVATDHADIAEAVRHHTGGNGADILLDLVWGPGLQDLVDAARPGATVIAGKKIVVTVWAVLHGSGVSGRNLSADTVAVSGSPGQTGRRLRSPPS
ncbi:zinc-binding dehydrogenase [Nocardia sp. NPDC024068]|uniref:zinc-binding dehydrogenase n=1 Tax=Nocardia sp. NPDC024068 TaxID=3157197 RepID=UPI0033E2FF19